MPAIGVMLPHRLPIDRLLELSMRAEEVGLDEVWVVEDCFWGGGISTAALVLAHTSVIRVGIGILPGVARNAAFTAMEFATLENARPGRLIPGIGHGMPDWMAQVGESRESPLAALEQTIGAVRSLLAGDTVTASGRYVRLDGVRLEFPPAGKLPVLAGVRGPRSLELSGRVADGTILAEPASVAYVKWAREKIDAGRASANRTDHHRIVTFNLFSADSDASVAIESVGSNLSGILNASTNRAQLVTLPFADELLLTLQRASSQGQLPRLPEEWVVQLAIAGTEIDCADRIGALAGAGVDSCVLVPPDEGREIDTIVSAGDVARRVRSNETARGRRAIA